MTFDIPLRSYKTLGLIIKRTNFSEADRILTVFTKEHGKIKVLAKGVRRITSKRSGNVELFNLAKLTLHAGKHFDLLTEAEVLESFIDIRKNLKKIGFCYHLCEIIDGLCPEHQENTKIFEEVLKTLNILNESPIGNAQYTNMLISNFEIFIIKELGFYPKDRELPLSRIDNLLENLLEKKLKSKRFLEKMA